MKTIILIMCALTISTPVFSQSSSLQLQNWVLEAVSEMPTQGGYQLNVAAPRSLKNAFTWKIESPSPVELILNAQIAKPSYCTSATYLIFYKVLQKYWASKTVIPSEEVLSLLKPNLENDGIRIWGRWNSNGPGTAKLFNDTQIGFNFDDIELALPGDFLKIFWNDQVGRDERGHTVIFLGRETVKGVEMIRFWGSSKSTNGYGIKLIPRHEAIRTLFSRLTNPDAFETIVQLDEVDHFLESMLTRVSNWDELRSVTGMTLF